MARLPIHHVACAHNRCYHQLYLPRHIGHCVIRFCRVLSHSQKPPPTQPPPISSWFRARTSSFTPLHSENSSIKRYDAHKRNPNSSKQSSVSSKLTDLSCQDPISQPPKRHQKQSFRPSHQNRSNLALSPQHTKISASNDSTKGRIRPSWTAKIISALMKPVFTQTLIFCRSCGAALTTAEKATFVKTSKPEKTLLILPLGMCQRLNGSLGHYCTIIIFLLFCFWSQRTNS